MAELADAHGSGPCEVHSWGFDSLRPHHFFKNRTQINMYAVLAELADAHGSGPCEAHSWGFDSLRPHHSEKHPNRVLFSHIYKMEFGEKL